jgi:hypothetical protein
MNLMHIHRSNRGAIGLHYRIDTSAVGFGNSGQATRRPIRMALPESSILLPLHDPTM